MMLLTVNTAANNGNFTNNTVIHHDEENEHITEWQLKPIETTENDPSAHNTRKTEKSTKEHGNDDEGHGNDDKIICTHSQEH